jgi:hypothetical protein
LNFKDYDDKIGYVLIKIPFEKMLEIAEKLKYKFPIEINDLDKDYKTFSVWNYFEKFQPAEIRQDRKRKFFTAAYSSSMRNKFEKFFDKDENKTIPAKDRILLTYEILSRTSYSKLLTESSIFSGNENDNLVGIERLIAWKIFLDAYPLHEVFI